MRKLMTLTLALIVSAAPLYAGTIIASTTTTAGFGTTNSTPASPLPVAGAYAFSLSASGTYGSLYAYLQQVGVSGAKYTIAGSSFTSSSNGATQIVVPDTYQGGNLIVQFGITSGTATFTVTASQIAP